MKLVYTPFREGGASLACRFNSDLKYFLFWLLSWCLFFFFFFMFSISHSLFFGSPFCFDSSFSGSLSPFSKIGIGLSSAHPLPHLKHLLSSSFFPFREAFNSSLNFSSSHPSRRPFGSISLKKKKKILLTILSGPHVHKKSREQYQIDFYRSFFFFSTTSLSDYKKFLEFKTSLYLLHFDLGFHLSFFYSRHDSVRGFLSL